MAKLGINSEIINGVNLVIFDKDGTLMDLYRYWSGMVALRVDLAQRRLEFNDEQKSEIMYAMGVEMDKERLKSEGPVGLKKREIVMKAMVDALEYIGFSYTKDLCYEVFKEADEKSINHFEEMVKPIKGAHKLINDLCKEGCKIAIATTDRSDRANMAMNYMGILGKFDLVIGADMVEHCKPAPEMINMIIKNTGVQKEEVVMVGDAITDVEMGINAEIMASVGVCSGLTPREKLLEKTRYVVDDISKIMTYMK